MKSYRIIPYVFQFKKPSGTSRGIMTRKKSWFIALSENEITGWGECSIIENLSPDYSNDLQYTKALEVFLESWKNDQLNLDETAPFPSIRFGIETALLDLQQGGRQVLFDTPFTRGEQQIRINGLIWMGSTRSMREQIEEKLTAGFRCIKLKIGAMPWSDEYAILRDLRLAFSAQDIEIRVDANGAYSTQDAPQILNNLAELEVHSIEQPIRAGQWEEMANLCATSPCPIALDEELIGVHNQEEQGALLSHIQPQYIILKPSLHGGISGTQRWISEAQRQGIQWWMTSALESNLGLNSIAQLASSYDLQLPQGLGTGSLYETNIPSPLTLKGEWLSLNPALGFTLDF
jgi:o-succinylbenzoate synthase